MFKDGKSDETGSTGGPVDGMDALEQLKHSALDQLSDNDFLFLYIEKRLGSIDLSEAHISKSYLKSLLKEAIDQSFDAVIDHYLFH